MLVVLDALHEITEKQGALLVEFARSVVYAKLEGFELKQKPELNAKGLGAFVTISKNGELRGCMGFVRSKLDLVETVRLASLAAAFEDPRFPPLTKDEFSQVKFELTLLGEPRLLSEFELKNPERHIVIGRDGLLIERGLNAGVLLPQVAVEYQLDATRFLDLTCVKAGLPRGCWKSKDTKVYVFSAKIFEEPS